MRRRMLGPHFETRKFLRLSFRLAAFLIFCFGTWSLARGDYRGCVSVYSSAASRLTMD